MKEETSWSVETGESVVRTGGMLEKCSVVTWETLMRKPVEGNERMRSTVRAC